MLSSPQDRHAVALEMPLVDASQDWHVLYGAENTWGTVLKVTRKLDTCDPDDYAISVSCRFLFIYKHVRIQILKSTVSNKIFSCN